MFKSTANFNTRNNALQRKPVQVIDFDGIATKFCSNTFSGITSSYKRYIKEFKRVPYKVDLLKFHTEFPKWDVTIVDDASNTLAGIIFANNIIGLKVDIYIGFQQLTLADFNHFYGYVSDYEFGNDREISISIEHKFRVLQRPIFRGLATSILISDEVTGALALDVQDVSNFQAGGDAPWGINTGIAADELPRTCVLVDRELYPYKQKTAGSPDQLVRETAGVTDPPYGYAFEYKNIDAGSKIYEVMILNGHMFFQALLQILTTTSAGTNGDDDLGLTGWGVGLDVDDIDLHQIYNEIGPYGKWSQHSTPGTYSPEMILSIYVNPHDEPVDNALEWIEKNLFPQMPAVFIITENGKLGIKVFDMYEMGEPDIELTQDDIIGIPKPKQDNEKFVTHIEIQRNYDGRTNDTAIEYYMANVTSQFGEKERLKLKLNSPETLVENDNFTDAYRLNYLFRVFGNLGCPIIKTKIKAFGRFQNLQPMDWIKISHDKLINVNTPNSLKTQWYEMAALVTSVGGVNKADDSPVDLEVQFPLNHIAASNILNLMQVYNQSDMDDYTLSISTDIDEGTLEAADAYIDLSTTYTRPDGSTEASFPASHVGFRFKLTQPAESGGDEFGSYCVVIIRAQDPAGTDIKKKECRLYYNETSADVIYLDYWLLDIGGGAVDYVSRIRADFYGINGTYAPTLELYQVKLWDITSTISSNTIKG